MTLSLTKSTQECLEQSHETRLLHPRIFGVVSGAGGREVIYPAEVCTTTRMHHCLTVSEILSSIFYHLRDRNRVASQRALASSARVCRAFKEPALNALYRELDEFIVPIIRTLPQDLWERSPDEISDGHRLVS